MADVATVVETVEAVAETAAPVMVPAGTLDYKKVAICAGIVVAVAGCGYLTYRIIKKRKAAKDVPEQTIIVNPDGDVLDVAVEEPAK